MIKISKKRFGIQYIITSLLITAILFAGYSCSTSDDYITRAEARRLVE